MGADVTFIVSAETAQAFNSFQKLIGKQSDSERAFKRQAAAGDRFAKGLSNAGRSVANFTAGLVSLSAATGFVTNLGKAMLDLADKSAAFGGELRPLLVDDASLANIEAVREQVLSLSGAYGMSRAEIVGALDEMSDTTGNLSATTRDELMTASVNLSRLLGGDLKENVGAVVKNFQAWRDAGVSVGQVQKTLMQVSESSGISIGELGANMPGLGLLAQQVGVGFDELAAGIIVAGRTLGSSEQAFTGMKQVLIKLGDAEERGVVLTGNLADKFSQFAGSADPDMIERVFGDRALGVAGALTRGVAELRQETEALQALPDGIIERKLGARLADTLTGVSESLRSIHTQIENLPLGGPEAEPIALGAEDLQLRRLGVKRQLQTMGPAGAALAEMPGFATSVAVARSFFSDADRELGVDLSADTSRRGGMNAEARALELRQGRERLNTEQVSAEGGTFTIRTPTTAADAERFGRLSSMGVTEPEFNEMLRMENSGRGSEAAFFERMTEASTLGALPGEMAGLQGVKSDGGTRVTLNESRSLLRQNEGDRGADTSIERLEEVLNKFTQEMTKVAKMQRDTAKMQQAPNRVTARNGGL